MHISQRKVIPLRRFCLAGHPPLVTQVRITDVCQLGKAVLTEDLMALGNTLKKEILITLKDTFISLRNWVHKHEPRGLVWVKKVGK